MTPGGVQVLGLCRFSLLVDGGFQKTAGASLDERRALLYHRERLARRFAWFEHVALPGIAAQTDPDFTLLVLTGQDFPEPWLSRLRALVAPVPQIRLSLHAPSARHRALLRRVMRSARNPEAEAVAEFRLDDDDGIATDYVARIRRDFEPLRPLWREHGRIAVDHVKGFALEARGDRLAPSLRIARGWVCALTFYARADDEKVIFDFAHHRIGEWMPVISFADQPMYVRGLHGDNDSRQMNMGNRLAMPPADIARALTRRFRIDPKAFASALVGLHGARA